MSYYPSPVYPSSDEEEEQYTDLEDNIRHRPRPPPIHVGGSMVTGYPTSPTSANFKSKRKSPKQSKRKPLKSKRKSPKQSKRKPRKSKRKSPKQSKRKSPKKSKRKSPKKSKRKSPKQSKRKSPKQSKRRSRKL